MKLGIRKSQDRGQADHGWLKSAHTFSFADYYDPNIMGFSVLRVINEDWIAGGGGFPTHPHRDMEIITYVVEGALEHKDSLGNSTIIKPGEVQRMSAGTGVRHSEFNHFKDKTTHLLQIWILPNLEGLDPSYEQKSFLEQFEKGGLVLVASHHGEQGSVSLSQDIRLWVAKPKSGTELKTSFPKNRKAWMQVVRGELRIADQVFQTGDGAAMVDPDDLKITAKSDSEFLLFDLPG